MLLDLVDRVLTPCPRPARAMGYLREAIGIRRRFRRCSNDWQAHIEHCRRLIERGMKHCKSFRKAVVFGAGLLHDVPLDELANTFRDVVLVDIVHPFTSRRSTRRFPNVKRVVADITNAISQLYQVADEPDESLPKSCPSLFLDDPQIDCVVSLNVLSQLPCMPMSYLARYRAHTGRAIENWARDVMRAHVDYLSRMSGQVVLITDVERLKIDMADQVVERRDLLFGLELPRPREEWVWKLAPCPEADRAHHFYRRVVGFETFPPRGPETAQVPI